jgi:hypothetical protein
VRGHGQTNPRALKGSSMVYAALAGPNGSVPIDEASQTRIAELRLENSRLRRLETDLLLEKIKLEEASQIGELKREPLIKPSTRPKSSVETGGRHRGLLANGGSLRESPLAVTITSWNFANEASKSCP